MAVTITKRPDATTVDQAKTGRWLAVNADYPVEFELSRKDYIDTYYNRNNDGTLRILISSVDLTSEVNIGDTVYVHSEAFPYIDKGYTVKTVIFIGSGTEINTNENVLGSWSADVGSGNYVNIISSRNDHRIVIEIIDSNTLIPIGSAPYRAFNSGKLDLDVTQWVKLPISINTDFSSVSHKNTETTRRFYIKFTEKYGSVVNENTDIYNYYAVSGAMQLQDKNAPNLLAYTAFNIDIEESEKAKFLSAFEKPTYFQGYPMKLGFIVETEGAHPNFQRIEDKFTETGGPDGSTSTSLVNPDFRYMNFVSIVGNYSETTKELDLYIDSSITPINSCAQLSADDWLYQSWIIEDGFVVGIKVEPNTPASDVASITSRPGGTLKRNTVQVDTLVWNATESRYEPSTGTASIAFTGTMEAEVLAIPVLTTASEACTLDFTQEVENINNPPTATNVNLTVQGGGTPVVGSILDLAYTFNDPDGDGEGTSIYSIREYDTELQMNLDQDGTSGTEVSTTLSHTVPAGKEGKYYKGFVTPVSLNQPTTGTIVGSNGVGPIQTTIMSYTHNKQTGHELEFMGTNGQSFTIDWGDGNEETVVATGSLVSYPHNYGSGGTKTVNVLGTPQDFFELDLQNQGLLTADLSNAEYLTKILLQTNSGLTSIANPTTYSGTGILSWRAENCDLTGTLDFLSMVFDEADIRFHSNANLTGFNIGSTSGTFVVLHFYSCNITGAVVIPSALDSSTGLSNSLEGYSNALLTSVDFSNVTRLSSLRFQGCGLSGEIDFGSIIFDNTVVHFFSNSGITGWDDSNVSGTYSQFQFNNCALAGNQALSIPYGSSIASNTFRVDLNNASAFTLDLSAAGSASSNMLFFYINNSLCEGTITLPEWTFSSGGQINCGSTNIAGFSSPNCDGPLASVDLSSTSITGVPDLSMFTWVNATIDLDSTLVTDCTFGTSSGTIDVLSLQNCNLTGTLSLGDFNFNDANIRIINNSLLTDIDFALCDGTMSELSINGNDLTGDLDLTGTGSLNFGSSGASLNADSNANLTGIIHPSGQTGAFASYSIVATKCVVQTNGLGSITIEADGDFNFQNLGSGITSTDIDDWFNEVEGHTAGSGASGTISGDLNPSVTAASLTARNNMSSAGYTVLFS